MLRSLVGSEMCIRDSLLSSLQNISLLNLISISHILTDPIYFLFHKIYKAKKYIKKGKSQSPNQDSAYIPTHVSPISFSPSLSSPNSKHRTPHPSLLLSTFLFFTLRKQPENPSPSTYHYLIIPPQPPCKPNLTNNSPLHQLPRTTVLHTNSPKTSSSSSLASPSLVFTTEALTSTCPGLHLPCHPRPLLQSSGLPSVPASCRPPPSLRHNVCSTVALSCLLSCPPSLTVADILTSCWRVYNNPCITTTFGLQQSLQQ